MPTYADNKEARFDYEILETLEAGLVLRGIETKAVRQGKISLRGAHVRIRNNRPVLINSLISPYQPNNTPETYNERRDRALLLHDSQIKKLIGFQQRQGLTLIPLRVYNKASRIKIEIALARGKKKYDKREYIKKRDFERRKQRELRVKV
ncbi:MAG: SsrA-binding protein [Parcubacteria group bacterium GW2011_GWA2_47_8]|nr:MAG: SsrA-binding protein [Parcubacteria group bacterium GW2011_GWA2_47_8]OHB20293.1 MAG: SsrA-binding protein [Parcubacteria group bacterium RIFCSPHIGHO2_01_FULL_47_10b]